MIESLKSALHLKLMVIQIDGNLKHLQEEILSNQRGEEMDCELSMKYFEKHFMECYDKLNKAPLTAKKPKNKKQQKNDFEEEVHEVNENSFIAHQYNTEKVIHEKKVHEQIYGKQKKKSKIPLKERRRIKFFNKLQKRGINPDKEHHHKTNVLYT